MSVSFMDVDGSSLDLSDNDAYDLLQMIGYSGDSTAQGSASMPLEEAEAGIEKALDATTDRDDIRTLTRLSGIVERLSRGGYTDCLEWEWT